MKHFFLLFVCGGACLFSACNTNNTSQKTDENTSIATDWERNNLKGKVKSIKMTIYATNNTNGRMNVDEYDEDEYPIHTIHYNTDGFITHEVYYNAKEEWMMKIKNTYNEKHRLIETETLYKDEAQPHYERSTYNNHNDVHQVVVYNPDKTTDTISYQYEQLPNGEKITQLNDFYKSFSKIERLYDKRGLLTKETAYNGEAVEEKTLFTYNDKELCIREQTYYDNGKEQYMQSDYTYDKYGNVLQIKTSGNNTAMVYYTEKHTYTYDEQGNIVKDVLQDSDTQRTVIYEITYYH